MLSLFVLFSVVIGSSIVDGQTCSSNDLEFTKNNQTLFTVTQSGTCVCQNYSGDGSQLTGLQNQPTISNLIQQSTSQNSSIVSLQTQVSSFPSRNTTAIVIGSNGAACSAGVRCIIVYTNKILDPSNAYNNVTGTYTAPTSGIYHVDASVYLNFPQNIDYFVTFVISVTAIDYKLIYNGRTNSGSWGPGLSVAASFTFQLDAGESMVVSAYCAPAVNQIAGYGGLSVYQVAN